MAPEIATDYRNVTEEYPREEEVSPQAQAQSDRNHLSDADINRREEVIQNLEDYLNSGTLTERAYEYVSSIIKDNTAKTATLEESLRKLRNGDGIKKPDIEPVF